MQDLGNFFKGTGAFDLQMGMLAIAIANCSQVH
jgi:hypothetical protein